MIITSPGVEFLATLISAPTGLVGELEFSVVEAEGGEVVSPPRTTGILEVAPGVYTAYDTVNSIGYFVALWTYEGTTASETITCGMDIPLSPTYATVYQVRAYAPELMTYTDEDILVQIIRAERDLDWYSGFGGVPNEESGLRFDPISDLEVATSSALTRACCAQVQYRLYMGPAFFVDELQYREVEGRDQTVTRAQRVGPQARSEFPRSLRKYTGRFA